jgi:hypothetical protein
MDAVIIRKIDLPIGINGITVLDENGDYNIYINDKLSNDRQGVAFRHEVEHIKQGHFYTYEDLLALEEQAEYGVV